MPDVTNKPILKLRMIAGLFEALHEHDILYCHWKSNEHLGASMVGETDLDVLFAENQKEKLEALLHQLGFKRFEAIKQKRYKDIVDFIALDPDSGKIVHLHTHYRLTMGEPYLKGYQFNFDIEEIILESRSFDKDFGIYCIQSSFELILLFLRESLKFRHRDIILMHLSARLRSNESVLREHRWLKSRTTDAEVLAALKVLFDDHQALYQLMTGEFSPRQLYVLSALIKTGNKVKRLYSPLKSIVLRWYREATVVISRNLAIFFDLPILFKRINPRGGVVVAVIGADGAGKSTIAENLKRTFEGKLDLYKIYFGRGDGRASWSRKLLYSAKTRLAPVTSTGPKNGKANGQKRKKGFIQNVYKSIEALLVAREKRHNMKLMKAAKRKGALVICDRYPQNQIRGYNDGPLLSGLQDSTNPLLRAIAKMESGIYAAAEDHPPDILFKLDVDPEISERRKPGEMSAEKLKKKINGIKQIRLNNACKVITVDATRPLNEVLYLIKKEIWNAL